MELKVPLTVPKSARDAYERNFRLATHGTGRLMLFAGDQKAEHLNDDFFGPGIHPDDSDPEHLFRIAKAGRIGAFATQLGLIARYGMDYPELPYVVKLNSRTNLIRREAGDPVSRAWVETGQILEIGEEHGLRIVGIGYTVYPGSEFEPEMLRGAAQAVIAAHRRGLLAILWIYPRGRGVKDERDPHLIAGAAGLGACLGADFVKVNAPKQDGTATGELLREAVLAAGRTGVICAGGESVPPEVFLSTLHSWVRKGGARGSATGRNIHQRSLPEAIRMCNAIFAITVEGKGVEEALALLRE